MKAVLKWLLGGIAVLAALVIAFFVGTRGDYPVAALVTEDAALPSQEVSGVALHLQIVEGPPAVQTIVVLHGGAGGDFRSLRGL